MNEKIKILRLSLNLSEKEVSSLLNISTYKYSSFEKKGTKIPCDILIMISKIYRINISLLLDPTYDKESIPLELAKELLDHKNKIHITEKLKYNLFYNKNTKLSYHTIKKVKNKFKQNIINFIENWTNTNKLNVQELALYSNIDENSLLSILSGKKFIDTKELIKLSQYTQTEIEDIVNFY